MAVRVVNVGMYERDTSGARTTNQRKSFGDQGAITVTLENQNYVFGPGQSITFSEDWRGIAVAAQDGRLRVADTRDGSPVGGAS